MRKILVAAMTAGLLAVAAPAFAGPGGTSEGTTQNGKGTNEVDCTDGNATGQQANVPGSGIWVKADGTPGGTSGALVLCNDGTTANGAPTPIQGRIIASGGASQGGGYIAADGDNSNETQAEGWTRVNIGASPSVRCGGPADANTSNDSTTNSGSQAACNP
ncbi:MAG: hypothetical protein ACT452_01675 [Microthrixaceae bacterium]